MGKRLCRAKGTCTPLGLGPLEVAQGQAEAVDPAPQAGEEQALAAGGAVPAGHLEAPHHPLPQGEGDQRPLLHDAPHELVAQDGAGEDPGDLAVVDVEVGAADGGELYLEDGVGVGLEAGLRHLLHGHLEGAVVDHRLHATSRATLTSSWAAWA
jgi:hypothetical protein